MKLPRLSPAVRPKPPLDIIELTDPRPPRKRSLNMAAHKIPYYQHSRPH